MPSLRGLFDRVERVLAQAAERGVDDPVVAEALMQMGKVQRWGRGGLEGIRSSLVHLAALPSHRDIRRLEAQVIRLKSALEEIRAQLDEQRALPPPAGEMETED